MIVPPGRLGTGMVMSLPGSTFKLVVSPVWPSRTSTNVSLGPTLTTIELPAVTTAGELIPPWEPWKGVMALFPAHAPASLCVDCRIVLLEFGGLASPLGLRHQGNCGQQLVVSRIQVLCRPGSQSVHAFPQHGVSPVLEVELAEPRVPLADEFLDRGIDSQAPERVQASIAGTRSRLSLSRGSAPRRRPNRVPTRPADQRAKREQSTASQERPARGGRNRSRGGLGPRDVDRFESHGGDEQGRVRRRRTWTDDRTRMFAGSVDCQRRMVAAEEMAQSQYAPRPYGARQPGRTIVRTLCQYVS